MQYYPENPKWQESWENFWEQKFSQINGFVIELTKNLGEEPKESRGRIQSAISYFKKGKELARIKYFLDDPKRRMAFIKTLKISINDLEDWGAQIIKNSKSLSVSQTIQYLYPNFKIERTSIEEGWIEPTFTENDYSNDKNLRDIQTELETGKRIVLIQAKIGKTRLLEYLYSSKESRADYTFFEENISEKNINNPTQKTIVWMLDSNVDNLRIKMIEKYKKQNIEKVSMLIMIDENENIGNILNELKLQPQKSKAPYSSVESDSVVYQVYQMEIVLKNSDSIFQVLETLEKYLPDPAHRRCLQEIKQFIKNQSNKLPKWCNTLDTFTKVIKIILDSGTELKLENCDWSSLLSEVISLKIGQLLPETLPHKKERVENILAEFAIEWLIESFERTNINEPRYSNSILLSLTQEGMQDLWNQVILKKKENLSFYTIQDIWKQLDSPKIDIEKLKESLWIWKFIDRQKLSEVLWDFPLWNSPCLFSKSTDFDSIYLNIKENVLTEWFSDILSKLDATFFKPLFPAILWHGDDAILDFYAIGEMLFTKIPDLVQEPIFQKTLNLLIPFQRHLWTLVASIATDYIPAQDVQISWEYILKFWDLVSDSNNTKESLIYFRDSQLHRYSHFLGFHFIQRHFVRLRKVSKKYCDTLPYIPCKFPILGDIIDNHQKRADWFAWALHFLTQENYDEWFLLEWAPLEWLAKKGNTRALNIISGEERTNRFELNKYKDKCRNYLGKGTSGWNASTLPDILVCSYLNDPEIFNWYKKLSLEQRQKFLGSFFSHALFGEKNKIVIQSILEFVKQENPQFLTTQSLQTITEDHSSLGDLGDFVAYHIYYASNYIEKNILAFLSVLSIYTEPNAYYNILDKIFLGKQFDWIENYWKCYGISDKEIKPLELLAQILEYSIENFSAQQHPMLKKFLQWLEGYSRILFEFWCISVKCSQIPRMNYLNIFLEWYDRRYNRYLSSNCPQEISSQEIEKVKKIIKEPVLLSGTEILYTKAISKLKFTSRLEAIEYLWNHLEHLEHNVSVMGNLIRKYISISIFSQEEKSQYFNWLLRHLSKKLENSQETNSLFDINIVGMFKNIPLLLEFISTLYDNTELYTKWREQIIQKQLSLGAFLSLPDHVVLFLYAKDNIVLDWLLSHKLDSTKESYFCSQVRVLQEIFEYAVAYDFAGEDWLKWIFEQIENQYNSLWPEILELIPIHFFFKKPDFRESATSILIRFLLTLDTETQIQRILAIHSNKRTVIFYLTYSPLIFNILSKLETENLVPILEECKEKLPIWAYPSTSNDRSIEFVKPFLEVIKPLSDTIPIFLDWTPNNAVLPILFVYIFSQCQNYLEDDFKSKYAVWCDKQIEKMQAATDYSIWQQEIHRSLWIGLLKTLPNYQVKSHQKACQFMLNNFINLDLPMDETYCLMDPLEISVKKLLRSGEKTFVQFIEEETRNSLALFKQNKSPYLLEALFEVLLPQLYQCNPNNDMLLLVLKETVSEPIPIFVYGMKQDIDPNYVFVPFIQNSESSQRAIEFYLESYMTTNDLACLVYNFWCVKATTMAEIVWEEWPAEIQKMKTKTYPQKILDAFANLGAKKITQIIQNRTQKYPKEMKLWKTFLHGLYCYKPHLLVNT